MKGLFVLFFSFVLLFANETLYVDMPRATPSTSVKTTFGQELKRLIDRAKSEISFAIYGLRAQDEILVALINAKNRGVKIRGVVDSDARGGNYYSDTRMLYNHFEIRDDKKSHIMHNKFFVIDKKLVWTGSSNISDTCSGGYNVNSVIVIENREVAKVYLDEFEQMFYKGRFANNKFNLTKTGIKTESSDVSLYFSPVSDTYNAAIKEIVQKAQKYIYIPIFYLTHKELSKELVKAKDRGVEIRVILDASAAKSKYSTHRELRTNGILVKVENFGGKMHSKSIIVDDRYIITGSMNLSAAGNDKNDENTVVLKNSALAKQYKQFFLTLWSAIPDKYLRIDPKPESRESVGSCSDGIDNDFNKVIDCNGSQKASKLSSNQDP